MRIFDIVISLSGILFLTPIFVIITLLIWLDTKLPFFLQERVGLNKKPFLLIKFRTMKKNTPSVGTHLMDNSAITKTGNFLRKTKLDELPQLWNVLTGDMSIVGPRPCLFNQRKLISERKKRRVFKVRPGITGLSQISGINMKTPILLAKTDQKMIKEMSLYNYFYYIFKTIFKNN